MVQPSVIAGLGFSIAICFLIFVGVLIYLLIKDKNLLKSFFIGALIFFVSQLLIRIPILNNVLSSQMWFNKMSMNPWIYGIFLALTAGIVEEVGRYIAFKYILKNNHKWSDGISYGLGHGGIEALLMTGFSCVSLLIGCIMINNGAFDSLMNSEGANFIYNQCISLTSTTTFIAGFERLCAISIHIGLSMIVLYGIRNKKIIYIFISILIHTLVNAPIVIFPQVFNIGLVGIELYVFIWAVILGGFAFYSKRLYKKDIKN